MLEVRRLMDALLRIRNLKKTFSITSGIFRKVSGEVRAVDGVDLDILPNETLGLVGESGCGKTTLSKLILALEEPDSGSISFGGVDMGRERSSYLESIRKGIQIVFQDPFGSLNPRRKVKSIIEEPMIIHNEGTARERLEKTLGLMRMVGLNEDMLERYPHEFSGGQRQRICIARALAIHPKLLICDEPVSALDVSIQAQVINLLVDLQKELSLSYLFISHNLSVVGYISHRIAVMYKGRIVELAHSDELFARPLHPYTKCLMEAVPEPRPDRDSSPGQVRRNEVLALGRMTACPCRAWCPRGGDVCAGEVPPLEETSPGHFVACHNPG
jgi:oligopeptide/dipeptide ABC transporter ATP-binding protein